jgi:hypothetical protein
VYNKEKVCVLLNRTDLLFLCRTWCLGVVVAELGVFVAELGVLVL